jgi:hypothetical protein
MSLRSSPRWLRSFAVALVLSTVGAVAGGCSGQGEGERCDHRASNGGNDDCQNGLTCQNPPGSVVTYPNGVCCPLDPALATTSACSPNTGVIDASPAPPDAGQAPVEAGDDAAPSGNDAAPSADAAATAIDATATDATVADATVADDAASAIDATLADAAAE